MHRLLILLVSGTLSAEVYTERDLANQFSQQNGYTGGTSSSGENSSSFANGISSGIFNAKKADESQVKYNEQNNTNGREYKAQDSANKGNTGAGVAAALGSALAAAAVPLLMSPFPSEQAAGRDLMAKSAMEFAQAAADAASAGKNSGQKNMLTRAESTGSTYQNQPNAGQTSGATNVSTPALDNYLQNRGINSEDFKRLMASGALNSPDAISKALGLKNLNLNDEDQARANRIAGQKTTTLLDLPPIEAMTEGELTDFEESDYVEETLRSLGNPSNITDNFLAANMAALESSTIQAGLHPQSPQEEGESMTNGSAENGPNLQAMLNGLMTKKDSALQPGLELSRTELESIGIKRTSRKTNIFDVSTRTFKRFGKWRKNVSPLVLNK